MSWQALLRGGTLPPGSDQKPQTDQKDADPETDCRGVQRNGVVIRGFFPHPQAKIKMIDKPRQRPMVKKDPMTKQIRSASLETILLAF